MMTTTPVNIAHDNYSSYKDKFICRLLIYHKQSLCNTIWALSFCGKCFGMPFCLVALKLFGSYKVNIGLRFCAIKLWLQAVSSLSQFLLCERENLCWVDDLKLAGEKSWKESNRCVVINHTNICLDLNVFLEKSYFMCKFLKKFWPNFVNFSNFGGGLFFLIPKLKTLLLSAHYSMPCIVK